MKIFKKITILFLVLVQVLCINSTVFCGDYEDYLEQLHEILADDDLSREFREREERIKKQREEYNYEDDNEEEWSDTRREVEEYKKALKEYYHPDSKYYFGEIYSEYDKQDYENRAKKLDEFLSLIDSYTSQLPVIQYSDIKNYVTVTNNNLGTLFKYTSTNGFDLNNKILKVSDADIIYFNSIGYGRILPDVYIKSLDGLIISDDHKNVYKKYRDTFYYLYTSLFMTHILISEDLFKFGDALNKNEVSKKFSDLCYNLSYLSRKIYLHIPKEFMTLNYDERDWNVLQNISNFSKSISDLGTVYVLSKSRLDIEYLKSNLKD